VTLFDFIIVGFLVGVIVLLLPQWPYWGQSLNGGPLAYAPSAIVTVILIVILVLIMTGNV